MENEIGISRAEIVAEVETIRGEGNNYDHIVTKGPLFHNLIGNVIENYRRIHEMKLDETGFKSVSTTIGFDDVKTRYNQLLQNG